MLTAIRETDGAKVIGEFTEKDSSISYRCEKCTDQVIHHRSQARLRIGHFAHRPGASCSSGSGETIEHLRTKLDIYQHIRSGWGASLQRVELEAWICDRSIRSDIYIETSKGSRIAIEVQASALTVDEIIRRTRKYHTEGIHVLWVLPFSFKRFYERMSERVYRLGLVRSDYYDEDHWIPREKVKLLAYEQVIYWSYMKRLIMWDLDHKYSSAFIVASLSQHIGDDVTFYSQGGEEHHYSGRKAKTLKVVEKVFVDVGFNQFERTVFRKDFKMAVIPYIIPARHILHFEPSKWPKLKRLKT